MERRPSTSEVLVYGSRTTANTPIERTHRNANSGLCEHIETYYYISVIPRGHSHFLKTAH